MELLFGLLESVFAPRSRLIVYGTAFCAAPEIALAR